MAKPIPDKSTIFAPALLVDDQPTDLLNLRIEELAWQERAAVARSAWAVARSKVLERARLREAHQRSVVQRWG